MKTMTTLLTAALVLSVAMPAAPDSHGPAMSIMSKGLFTPQMDAAEGRKLFASKGCVVCHSINGVDGEDAPMLDAEFMDLPMNPFEFAARMWRGAEAMVALQREELGEVTDMDGAELAAIIAFVHDAEEQAKFSEADIPEDIKALIGHLEKDGGHSDREDPHE